jgi:hypothetical protein
VARRWPSRRSTNDHSVGQDGHNHAQSVEERQNFQFDFTIQTNFSARNRDRDYQNCRAAMNRPGLRRKVWKQMDREHMRVARRTVERLMQDWFCAAWSASRSFVPQSATTPCLARWTRSIDSFALSARASSGCRNSPGLGVCGVCGRCVCPAHCWMAC